MHGLMTEALYDLRQPTTDEDWKQYHAIRRRVLWERRDMDGEYDENHPDEQKPNNYPLLLEHDDVPVGVVRVDIRGRQATFRRVAVREDVQRMGHGRVLLSLAERFARENGCECAYAYASPDAVTFYEKCGFHRDSSRTHPKYVPMAKQLDVLSPKMDA